MSAIFPVHTMIRRQFHRRFRRLSRLIRVSQLGHLKREQECQDRPIVWRCSAAGLKATGEIPKDDKDSALETATKVKMLEEASK
jgi:hypothetical protein